MFQDPVPCRRKVLVPDRMHELYSSLSLWTTSDISFRWYWEEILCQASVLPLSYILAPKIQSCLCYLYPESP